MDRVVVVGGGIVGLMHAAQARQRGYEVIHLEREAGTRGASVRNFGLIWISGRAAGPELQLALRARQLWEEIADQVEGTGFRPHGSLTLASCEAELTVLKEAAAAQLLLVQRLDGRLTIGDTHSYAEPFPFDVDEAPYDHLRARAAELLGSQLPPTRLRWAGVYSQVTNTDLYHRSRLADGMMLVTGPGGRGMTCSPAIAEETYRMEAM